MDVPEESVFRFSDYSQSPKHCWLAGAFVAMLAFAFMPKLTPAQSSPSQPAAPAASTSQTPADQAAERKRKFEEDERRLENGEVSHDDDSSSSEKQPTLFVSPAEVGMLVNGQQSFTLFDISGHNVTSKATWSLSNSDVADLVAGPAPTIVAKEDGTVTLRADVAGETSEARIKVYRDKMPMGAVLWREPKIPGYTAKQIVQAVPTANGPDLYSVEKNADGSTLVRAVHSDGRQMWMTKMGGPPPAQNQSNDPPPAATQSPQH
jgi:hypothetical protein